MAQYELNLRDYWRIIHRRRWVIIFVFIATIFFTAVFTNMQEEIYQADTTVKVERRLSETALLTQMFVWSPGEFMSTESRVIESGPVIEEVAHRLNLIDTPVYRQREWTAQILR